MTGHRAWQIATTTKMHFQSDSYNAFKFNFKTKQLTPEIFSRQRNMFLFEKLARRFNEDEMKTYAFVNYFFRNATWAGDLSEEPYIEFIKRTQTFSYRFKQDLNKMPDKTLDELLSPIKGDMPEIMKLYLASEIMAETVIAFHCVTNFINAVDPHIEDRLLWPDVRNRILKATPFVGPHINQKKMRSIIKDYFARREV